MEWLTLIPPEVRAILGAFFFALVQVLLLAAPREVTPLTYTLLINLTMLAFLGGAHLAAERVTLWSWAGFAIYVVIGVVGLAGARLLNHMGIRLVGASRTNVLISASPLVSLALALLAFGERPGPGVYLGTALIAGGVSLIYWEPGATRGAPLRLLLVPTLSALCYGVTPALRKLSLLFMDLPALAIAVAAATATLSLLAAERLFPEGQGLRFTRASLRAGLAAGLLSVLIAAFFWTSLRDGDLATIGPLIRLSPLFVLLLSPLLARRREVINLRTAAAALIVVGGAALVAGRRG